jgi:hypothetical protein
MLALKFFLQKILLNRASRILTDRSLDLRHHAMILVMQPMAVGHEPAHVGRTDRWRALPTSVIVLFDTKAAVPGAAASTSVSTRASGMMSSYPHIWWWMYGIPLSRCGLATAQGRKKAVLFSKKNRFLPSGPASRWRVFRPVLRNQTQPASRLFQRGPAQNQRRTG